MGAFVGLLSGPSITKKCELRRATKTLGGREFYIRYVYNIQN